MNWLGLGWLCITTRAREQSELSGCEAGFGPKMYVHTKHLCGRLSVLMAVLVTVSQPVRAHMGHGLC